MSYNNESCVDSLNQTVPLYSINSSFIDEVPIDVRDTSDRQDKRNGYGNETFYQHIGAGKRGAQARVLPRRTDSIDLGGTQFDQIYKERVKEIRMKQVDGQESNITSNTSGDERNNEKDAENREIESQATQSTFERDEEQKSYSDSQNYISEMKSEFELVTQDEITESSQKKQQHKQKHAEVDIEEIKAKLLENYLLINIHQAEIQQVENQYKIEQQMRKDAETRETRLAAEKEILLKRIINDETKMKGFAEAAAAVSATLASNDNRFFEFPAKFFAILIIPIIIVLALHNK
ncbi:MAG: hypothetical protein EZS28_027169 [Streblomastix strix]|uniref:Uncharacterized protein n=1 Tax=Streblomastix strix TaxID=222440 RepID=A0A5J4V4N6_9EUKA|nr:MAG: hypothetical protein EZS28_027169 [Streblomastix strix]